MTNQQNQVKYSWQILHFEWSHLMITSIDTDWVIISLYRGEFWACGPLKGSYVFTRTHTDYPIPWSMAVLFSAWFSMSFENHSLNSSCESNNVGIMKWSKAHSCQWEQAKAVRKNTQKTTSSALKITQTSAILFWMGVPVKRSLFLHKKPRRIFQRTL